MIMVPLGMLLSPACAPRSIPKDLWEKVQKNEKIDKAEDGKLKAIATRLHAVPCGRLHR